LQLVDFRFVELYYYFTTNVNNRHTHLTAPANHIPRRGGVPAYIHVSKLKFILPKVFSLMLNTSAW